MSGYHDDFDQNDYKPQGVDATLPAMGCFSSSGTSEGALDARRDRYCGVVRRVRAHLPSKGAMDAQIDHTTRSVIRRLRTISSRAMKPRLALDKMPGIC
jgi:hypothetical protein